MSSSNFINDSVLCPKTNLELPMDSSGHRAGSLVQLRGWWDTHTSSSHCCQQLQECCRHSCSSPQAVAAPSASSNPFSKTISLLRQNLPRTAAQLPSLPPHSILTHQKSTGPPPSRYFPRLNTPTRVHTALRNARLIHVSPESWEWVLQSTGA